jgi:hypothetical protein
MKVTAVRISATCAPALGDVRNLGVGDWVALGEGATDRRDWPRYAEAIAAAVTRGADVRWVRRAS